MICFSFILVLACVFLKPSDGVKVNMQGSIALGKDVVEALKFYIRKNKLTESSGRRVMDEGLEEDTHTSSDTIAVLVNAAFLCRDLQFCKGEKEKFINDYIITLTKVVESVFKGLMNNIDNNDKGERVKVMIFEDELKVLIYEIKKLLKTADEKVNGDNEDTIWQDLLKRINAKFQDRAVIFASQRLEGNLKEISVVKKKLTQKLITNMITVELDFESTLCSEHEICTTSNECTKALNTLLEKMKTVPDDRAKEFIRYFFETLQDTNFYNKISDTSAHEFQSILYDMAYAENILTMNILSTLHRSVEERLEDVNSRFNKRNLSNGRDVKLVHVILSDMDHFYNKPKKEPFHDFLTDFYVWSKEGGKFSTPLRRTMKDIQNLLSYEPEELVSKLVNEVRVFMEITVDPPNV